ncbi:MAG: hypothetical protein JNK77_17680 [Saprospiraceae bacterium]|nr:hypothetical protein [Saprospiraceae bacterium]
MTTNNNLTWIVPLVFLSIFSCKWESQEDLIDPCNSAITWTPAPPDTCFELPISPIGFVDATTHWPIMQTPHYCPFDPDKFAYLAGDYYGGEVRIQNVNLCTGDNKLVISAKSINYPQWGADDWILFSREGGALYMIKSDGDSLKQLNDSILFASYFWINDGLAIHAKHNNINLILNTDGEIFDTIPFSIGMGAYKNHRLAVWGYINSQNSHSIGVINLENWQFTPYTDYEPFRIPLSISWLDDETIVWSNTKGIHTANILTGHITTIKATPCDILRYNSVSGAPDSSGKLLTTRTEYIYVNPDSLVSYRRISLLDTHTGQEWILGLE